MTKSLCQRFPAHSSVAAHAADGSRYLSVERVASLPLTESTDDLRILNGYAVGLLGTWYVFEDLAPAYAFARAARMATDVHGYDLHRAATQRQFCAEHLLDEQVLLLGAQADLRADPSAGLEQLKRFVQGVKEHPWSSHWHGTSGYITRLDRDGEPVHQARSLPL